MTQMFWCPIQVQIWCIWRVNENTAAVVVVFFCNSSYIDDSWKSHTGDGWSWCVESATSGFFFTIQINFTKQLFFFKVRLSFHFKAKKRWDEMFHVKQPNISFFKNTSFYVFCHFIPSLLSATGLFICDCRFFCVTVSQTLKGQLSFRGSVRVFRFTGTSRPGGVNLWGASFSFPDVFSHKFFMIFGRQKRDCTIISFSCAIPCVL